MELHRGRLIDHVQLVVADLGVSKRFYEAVLGVIGLTVQGQGPGYFYVDELYVSQGTERHTLVHLAFQAENQELVRKFHQAGLSSGGRDNGQPGERPYHPGYFAAFLFDPDGNNIEAVYHGPGVRSAPSVVIRA